MQPINRLKENISKKLISYYRENICSYPHGQLRNNIKLHKLSNQGVLSNYIDEFINVSMPTSDIHYQVYVGSSIDFSNIYKGDWIRTDILLSKGIYVDIALSNGYMIPKRYVYLKECPDDNTTYIAIDKRYPRYKELNKQPIYATVYVDSTYEHDKTYLIDYQSNLGNVTTKMTIVNKLSANNVTLYIDGLYIHNPKVTDIPTDRDVDIELYINHDQDDVKIQTTRCKYTSIDDNKSKDVVMLDGDTSTTIRPISITHMYIYDPIRRRGVKVNYAYIVDNYQLTHIDLCIPSDIIDNIQSMLGVDEVHIKVVSNKYDNISENKLSLHDHWFNILRYNLTDDELINIYRGNEPKLPNISGSILEQSYATKMISGKVTFLDKTPDEIISMFVSGYGDIAVANILNHDHITILDKSDKVRHIDMLTIPRSVMVEEGIDTCSVDIYIKGIRIPSNNIDRVTTLNNETRIYFRDNITIHKNTYVEVVCTPGIVHSEITSIVPTIDDNKLTYMGYLDKDRISIYVEDTDTYKLLKGNEKDSSCILEVDNNITNIVFNVSMYGKNIYIVPNDGIYQTNVNINIKKNEVNETISVEVLDGVHIPDMTHHVYLNGRRLIPNLDYSVDETTVYIQNYRYLNIGNNNNIDIISYKSKVIDEDVSLYIDGKFSRDTDNEILHETISSVYIDGRYVPVENIHNEYKDTLSCPELDIPNYVSTYVVSSIPTVMYDIISKYDGKSDISKKLYNYLLDKDTSSINIEECIVTTKPSIYSIYLNTILYDIVHDRIEIPENLSYTDSQIHEIVSKYTHLRSIDVIFKENVIKSLATTLLFDNIATNKIELNHFLGIDITDVTDIPLYKRIMLHSIVDRTISDIKEIG